MQELVGPEDKYNIPAIIGFLLSIIGFFIFIFSIAFNYWGIIAWVSFLFFLPTGFIISIMGHFENKGARKQGYLSSLSLLLSGIFAVLVLFFFAWAGLLLR